MTNIMYMMYGSQRQTMWFTQVKVDLGSIFFIAALYSTRNYIVMLGHGIIRQDWNHFLSPLYEGSTYPTVQQVETSVGI